MFFIKCEVSEKIFEELSKSKISLRSYFSEIVSILSFYFNQISSFVIELRRIKLLLILGNDWQIVQIDDVVQKKVVFSVPYACQQMLFIRLWEPVNEFFTWCSGIELFQAYINIFHFCYIFSHENCIQDSIIYNFISGRANCFYFNKSPSEQFEVNCELRHHSEKNYAEQIRTYWVLNISIHNFPKTENGGLKSAPKVKNANFTHPQYFIRVECWCLLER